MAKSTTAGQPAVVHAGASDGSLISDIQDTVCNGAFTVLTGTTDAVPFPGNVAVNSAGVNAMTLAAPKAGPQPAGDDGKTVFIVAINSAAHTVTTPTNAILNSKHLATWTAAIGNCLELRAFNGTWLVSLTTGVTVT